MPSRELPSGKVLGYPTGSKLRASNQPTVRAIAQTIKRSTIREQSLNPFNNQTRSHKPSSDQPSEHRLKTRGMIAGWACRV
ncbi:MAG: hypothetical protein HC936_02630 [Leptolyngbyaceae cyanobacterium SU_3_3]|nr:hypothetical protein [Leptolyngbyaceae cyanobacterium SU_3_3]